MRENKYNFQKLTPINDVDLKIYEDALDFAFANDDIKNVAISGAYSSGKSSVIETYKKMRSDVNFINISLAHFESTETDDSKSKDDKDKDKDKDSKNANVLEGKIINQLIHQIDYEKIPQTNFKLKQNVYTTKIGISALKFTLFLLLIMYIVKFNNWCEFISSLSQEGLKNILLFTTDNVCALISGIISTYIFGSYAYSIIKMQKNQKLLKKVKFQGNELEIFEQNEESYFDKHLNEILYLFENCGAHAIVFEDMDRYNINQIFEKLREINTLINKKRKTDSFLLFIEG